MNKNKKATSRLSKNRSPFTLIIDGKDFSETVFQLPASKKKNEKVIGSVEAIDRKGVKYKHKVFIVLEKDDLKPILSFGHPSPICYYLASLAESYPFNEDLCIDGTGHYHGTDGSVYIKKGDMNKLFIKATRIVKGLVPESR
jgi:hypothetical protein